VAGEGRTVLDPGASAVTLHGRHGPIGALVSLGRVLSILWWVVVHYVAVAGRGELADKAWAAIEPLLPAPGGARGRWRDHRQVINGILWKLRTGAPWRDLPERYGPWKTCHERLRRWTADRTWDKILARAQVRDDGQPVDWVVAVAVVRAHQHSAGARKKGAPRAGQAGSSARSSRSRPGKRWGGPGAG
jgi:transposase